MAASYPAGHTYGCQPPSGPLPLSPQASKRWCKTLPVELVDKALLSFAHNGGRGAGGCG